MECYYLSRLRQLQGRTSRVFWCVCVYGVNTVVKYVLSMCEPLIPISSAPTHNTHRAWAIQDVIEAVKEREKDMI